MALVSSDWLNRANSCNDDNVLTVLLMFQVGMLNWLMAEVRARCCLNISTVVYQNKLGSMMKYSRPTELPYLINNKTMRSEN